VAFRNRIRVAHQTENLFFAIARRQYGTVEDLFRWLASTAEPARDLNLHGCNMRPAVCCLAIFAIDGPIETIRRLLIPDPILWQNAASSQSLQISSSRS
jgi:hypothetical protein